MSLSRPRILFLAEGATMAHFVRPLALAAGLDAAAYDVHFYSPVRFAFHLNGHRFAVGTLECMPGDQFLNNLSNGSPLFPVEVIRRYVREDRQIIRSLRPDLVIGDMRLSLPVSARLEGVRCAVMINAYWSPFARRRSIIPEIPLTRIVPPRLLGPLFRLTEPLAYAAHVRPVNQVRKEAGMLPLPSDIRAMYTDGDYVLYPDVPEFVPTSNLPESHAYVGICEWAPATAKPAWWDQMRQDARPKVFISLGSSGPLRAMPALLRALERLPVAVVISTSGRELPAGAGRSPYVAGLLPFTETAALASVVVSHGGSGGLYPAMAAGTPVLGVPSNADQQISTAVLAESGAGLGVRVEEASEVRLRKALEALLFDARYRAAAQGWAHVFARYESATLFEEFLRNALG